MAVAAVCGTAGVGKSALAVHWAHHHADRFPDGQLYVNLEGYSSGTPVQPIEALGVLLRSLGTPPERVPVDAAEAAALYRSRIAGRRILVLLDNARSVDQVRPLLPGAPGCLVLVTSRDRLGGLVARNGARRLTLDVLAPDEARDLLVQVLGEERVSREAEAVVELAAVCAYLPLALRVAAATLLNHPHRSVADHVEEIRDRHGLMALAVDGDEEAAVRIALDLSYRTVDADTRRLFRLLGLVPGADVSIAAAAALSGLAPEQVGPTLDQLAAAHLLEERTRDRFTFHDLLRRYARDQCGRDDEPDERTAALGRLLEWYLCTVDAAARTLYPEVLRLPLPPARYGRPEPDFPSRGEALAWLDAERANLVAAIHHAAHHGPRRMAWLLTDGIRGYRSRRGHMVDWYTTGQAGLLAAAAEGDLAGQAAMHQTLAQAHSFQGKSKPAIDHLTKARALSIQGGWVEGYAAIVSNLGIAYHHVGRSDDAIANHIQAIDLYRRGGHRAMEARTLGNLGNSYLLMGKLRDAGTTIHEALDLYERMGNHANGEGEALETGASTSHLLGRFAEATDRATRSLALLREVGNHTGEAKALTVLAEVLADTGRHTEAIGLADAAVAITEDIGDSRIGAYALSVLAAIHGRLGHHTEAVARSEQALAAARAIDIPHAHVVAQIALATARARLGRYDLALDDVRHALDLASRGRYGVLEGQALTCLAEIHLNQGDLDTTVESGLQALDNHRRTGHRLGEARVLDVLGQAFGSGEAGRSYRSAAHEIVTEIGAGA